MAATNWVGDSNGIFWAVSKEDSAMVRSQLLSVLVTHQQELGAEWLPLDGQGTGLELHGL